MDYYSNFPGPTKDQAKEVFKQNLKPVLQRETNAPAQFIDKTNRIIDESVNEGVNKAHKGYSQTGWAVFGSKECETAIRDIHAKKIKEFKSKQKKENNKKLALGKNPSDVQRHIMTFLGGKKRRKTKRKRRFKKGKTKKRGGGMLGMLSGLERIRGQRYDKWLEQRLVLVHNDTEFVNKVRQRFGYDKTNIVGRGQLTKKMVEDELCERSEEQREMIDPSLKCDHSGGKRRKTRKRKKVVKKKKRSTRKH